MAELPTRKAPVIEGRTLAVSEDGDIAIFRLGYSQKQQERLVLLSTGVIRSIISFLERQRAIARTQNVIATTQELDTLVHVFAPCCAAWEELEDSSEVFEAFMKLMDRVMVSFEEIATALQNAPGSSHAYRVLQAIERIQRDMDRSIVKQTTRIEKLRAKEKRRAKQREHTRVSHVKTPEYLQGTVGERIAKLMEVVADATEQS